MGRFDSPRHPAQFVGWASVCMCVFESAMAYGSNDTLGQKSPSTILGVAWRWKGLWVMMT